MSDEEGGEPIELPLEQDGCLLLSTVRAQFPTAGGLLHREMGRRRGLRLLGDRLAPPPAGWAGLRFWCGGRPAPRPTRDLVVLGLPWRAAEDAVREHFAALGELLMVQVKRDPRTGASKGFGFIKFAEEEAQEKALSCRHQLLGRWVDVRVPRTSRVGKVFVGRCTEEVTAADLQEYFSEYGVVTDVYMPRPFRSFGFVTFADAEVAASLVGQDHIVKGVSVSVSAANPRRPSFVRCIPFHYYQ